MMNVSELLTSLKLDLGVYSIALPFPDENKVLHDNIKLRTIKTFSQFAPHVIKIDLQLNELTMLKSNYTESVYEIPDIFGDRKLMNVRKVELKNKLLGNGYMGASMEGSYDMFNSTMMAQAGANLMSSITPPFTFKFQAPNLLYLYNTSTMANELSVEFAVEHFDNLSSIPNTAWESFYDLALLDTKKLLYGALKHYSELQTAHGTINLRIDDWANAESDRKELISHWRDVHHLDGEQFFII